MNYLHYRYIIRVKQTRKNRKIISKENIQLFKNNLD